MANEQPTKKCPRCGETKSLSTGYTYTWRIRKRDRVRKPHVYCRQCRVAYNSKFESKLDPAVLSFRRRNTKLKQNYGITVAQHAAQLASQGGGCAICGRQLAGLSPQTVHVDHNHGTMALRGILCGPCNTGIGSFRENPAFLRAAIAYLASGGVWRELVAA